jgi:hypothetical protein
LVWGEGTALKIRLIAGFPEGIQVAITVPLFGELVTVTCVGPVSVTPGTVTHKV